MRLQFQAPCRALMIAPAALPGAPGAGASGGSRGKGAGARPLSDPQGPPPGRATWKRATPHRRAPRPFPS
jgi:hypothetical protein